METYGNPNLLNFNGHQYVNVSGTSNASTGLDSKTVAVQLLATSDCWVMIGQPGASPTAVKTAAEETRAFTFFVPADTLLTFPVPIGTSSSLVKIAAIQDSASGVLHIYERRP